MAPRRSAVRRATDDTVRPRPLAARTARTTRTSRSSDPRSDDALLARLLDEAPARIVLVAPDGTIQYLNHASEAGFRRLAALLPVPADHIVGQPIALLGTLPDGARWETILARQTEARCTLGPETISVRTTPVTAGRTSATLLTWSFVTEALAREERITALTGRMAAIDNTQAVITFAMDGTILDANPNFLRVSGYALDEIRGRHHRMFVDENYAASDEYRAFWDRLNRGEFDSQEYRRVGKGGREVWIRASYNPICDRTGRPFQVVKYAIDITAQRQRVDDILSCLRAARSGDLTRVVAVSGHDAIGQIGEVLTEFLSDLRDSLRSITDHAHSLSTAAEELSAVSQSMSSNAEETSAQAKVVSSTAALVTGNIQTVASAAEDLTSSIHAIARNAADAAAVATTAVSVARDTNDTVAKLGESSAAIGKVAKMITAIAQQTKLLALNATIEAARAGEAGKGFAVVANEVKELAKETAQATEDIGLRIEAIQADSTSAVEAIQQIGTIVGEIHDKQTSIAGAVEQQTITTNDIRRSAVEAATGSDEITQNIAEVARAAQGTTSGASDTQTAAGELARMAAALQGLVGHFRC